MIPAFRRLWLAAALVVACVPRERRGGSERGGAAPSGPAAQGSGDRMLTKTFTDNFERDSLGDNWRSTSAAWRLERGALCVAGARNHPVWLRRRLPRNAVIEFSATSHAAAGDIKAEFWGDGRSHATGLSYNDATGYLSILGGWRNRYHVLARLDEHAEDRREIKIEPSRTDLPLGRVEPGRKYRFRIERSDGRSVRWFVDDQLLLTYKDPKPLRGDGHEHIGFNNWEARVCFDDLRVEPR